MIPNFILQNVRLGIHSSYLICLFDLLSVFFIICILLLLLPQIYYLKEGIYETPFPVV